MNNSTFQAEEGSKQDYQERAGKLATLIEAAEAVLASLEWRTLKNEEFDPETARLERLLIVEAKKHPVNEPELYRLQGRIEQHARLNLEGLVEKFRVELESIKRL